MFEITFKPSVEKDFRRISKAHIAAILKKIRILEMNSTPHQAVKLTGTEGLYRLRVGDYRIVYGVNYRAKQILIHYVRHRREVYRGLS